jgi:predicted  nucleic acid-binding Zn-ribbon protein
MTNEIKKIIEDLTVFEMKQQNYIENQFKKIDTKNKLITDLQKQIYEQNKRIAKMEWEIEDLQEENVKLKSQIETMTTNKFAKGQTYKIEEIANELDLTAKGLVAKLRNMGVLERINGINQLTPKYRNKGYEVLAKSLNTPNYSETTQKVYTAEGAKFIYNLIKNETGSEADDTF